ncbi:PREDICTED: uncharacterized protein LOC105565087 isoform X3 [Vollenhovia emeryi]|uniref:uncharacterized protein LOC105565087 isoform X3 n=1 Tax=Vollenhovia emeryi TaxID=411798 RepID=UPI0005F4CB73|nr:PREDICTED: uncharacterized protein LOC105565087 isoform X3 [Vollenhovia emeryi]
MQWPARSPDLTAPDDFLWGFVKSKVYETRPATILELEQRIRVAIEEISQNILRSVAGDKVAINVFFSGIGTASITVGLGKSDL